jgi:hypothetical protein
MRNREDATNQCFWVRLDRSWGVFFWAVIAGAFIVMGFAGT